MITNVHLQSEVMGVKNTGVLPIPSLRRWWLKSIENWRFFKNRCNNNSYLHPLTIWNWIWHLSKTEKFGRVFSPPPLMWTWYVCECGMWLCGISWPDRSQYTHTITHTDHTHDHTHSWKNDHKSKFWPNPVTVLFERLNLIYFR